MYMYVAYIQIFSVLQKGGGGGGGEGGWLACDVLYVCIWRNSYHLDTPDRYQNIPILLMIDTMYNVP